MFKHVKDMTKKEKEELLKFIYNKRKSIGTGQSLILEDMIAIGKFDGRFPEYFAIIGWNKKTKHVKYINGAYAEKVLRRKRKWLK